MSKRINNLIIFFFLTICCFIVYYNSFNGVFISDDHPCLIEYTAINFLSSNWSYLPSFLNTIAFKISGLHTFGHHFISIFLHAINSFLAFLFLKIFFKKEVSFLGALIFAVHPIHTECVTWISGRSYSVISFLMLSCYLSYYKKKLYPLSIALFLYGITNFVGSFVMFPFVLLFSDFYLGENKKRIVPFFLVLLIGILFNFNVIADRFILSDCVTYSGEKLFGAFVTFFESKNHFHWTVIPFNFIYNSKLLCFPLNLTFYHEKLFIIKDVVTHFFVYILTIMCILSSLLAGKGVVKKFWFILVLFLLSLFPSNSPINVCSIIAERYLYFPSVFFCMFICVIIEFLYKFRYFVFVPLFCFYSFLTIQRNCDYFSELTFWKKTALVSPYSSRAHNNLGIEYLKIRKNKMALECFVKSYNLDNTNKNAFNNMMLVAKKFKNAKIKIQSKR